MDRGDIELDELKGSWAGAMGQPQFMPSSYLKYAEDFDGDGRATSGRRRRRVRLHCELPESPRLGDGEPWGREVRVTPTIAQRAAATLGTRKSGCRAIREMIGPARLAAWQRLGVRGIDGGKLMADPPEAALVRAGRHGFLVHGNYNAILRYNCALARAQRRDPGRSDRVTGQTRTSTCIPAST